MYHNSSPISKVELEIANPITSRISVSMLHGVRYVRGLILLYDDMNTT